MSTQQGRQLYLDNLRLTMIVLIVMVHTAVTYSGIGSWYYIEPAQLDLVLTVVFGLFQGVLGDVPAYRRGGQPAPRLPLRWCARPASGGRSPEP